MSSLREPLAAAVYAACSAAQRSPCRKSRRGAILFHPFTGFQTPPAFNSRPDMKCDERCNGAGANRYATSKVALASPPSPCSMLCLHAEQRALRFASEMIVRTEYVADGDLQLSMQDLELVHVKVDPFGALVPSGPPSCWQCAKEIADACIMGVWLYELAKQPAGKEPAPTWIFYPTKQFYDLTLTECHLDRAT